MKKLILIGSLLLLLVCSSLMLGFFKPVTQEKFDNHAELFYIQMFTDGQQSEQVNIYYEDMIHVFDKFEDDPLYKELELMYEALGEDGKSAEIHRQKVMNMINERP
ncbi:hypothetical protein BhaS171_00026 [Bacillus phage vB_BhaS-171]|uniref:hypothetical protein n=1 Tax=Bacillus phage vB_BhaS-171 TaxID=1775140 RepID=UPI000744C882|nr:hypothetical protein BH781_gp26 [Bacillus phage vB_BhaS-171]ALY08082.1 hypothetical protein BhaS171_00026 [Bacillus phage vB_BhaS-171]